MSLNYCAIRTALSALLLHFISAQNITSSSTSPDHSSTWTTITTTVSAQMTTVTKAASKAKDVPTFVFVIVGIVVTLIVIVVVIAVVLILRRPKQFTGLDNLLVGNDGMSSLNGGSGTQVPLMDSSYETGGGTDMSQDMNRNSEYLSRAVVKYRFESNEDYKDQMSVEKDDQLLVKEKYEDGWWLVQKEATNEEGIVPGSYCHDIAANRRPSEPFISAHVS